MRETLYLVALIVGVYGGVILLWGISIGAFTLFGG